MKRALATAGLVLAVLTPGGLGAEGPRRPAGLVFRYGIQVDLHHYPQSDPRETICSVIRAARAGDIEYLLAHLLSPEQVDQKLKGDRWAMKRLASRASPKRSQKIVEALELQLKEGTWTVHRHLAWVWIEGLPDLSLEKIGDDWFMHNTPVPRPAEK